MTSNVLNSYIFCSYYMTGVIWLIQLITYPALTFVENGSFINVHKQHSNRMSILVGPIMIVELMSALYLAQSFEEFWLLNVFMVLSIWCFTFLVSVPIHNQLQNGKNAASIRKLVHTNWPRTILWTLKSVFVLCFQLKVLG